MCHANPLWTGTVTKQRSEIKPPGSKLSRDPTTAIAQRWEWWLPVVTIAAHRSLNSTELVAIMREKHSDRCYQLLNAGIRWTTIRKRKYDDPRPTDAIFEATFALAVERRRCRLGWQKGKHRGKYVA